MEETQQKPRGVTMGALEARQRVEVDEGIEVKIYIGNEENEDTYAGSVGIFNDPKGYNQALDRLKARKPKNYQWSEAELAPLRLKAENGTFWRWIKGFREDDGTPIANTPENLARIMDINYVRRICNERLADEQSWQEAHKEALKGNS
jgi:hypothetical protein